MTELELILTETGAALEWPATPDLGGPVAARIRAQADAARPDRTRLWMPRLRRPLAAALAALLLLAATAAAVPGIRDPVLDWLGLRSGVKIERVPRLPIRPVPEDRLALGTRRATVRTAARQLDFTPVVASGLGTPRAYTDEAPPGGRLSLTYRGGDLILTEFQGRLRRMFMQKFLGPGTNIERVEVNGERGLWIHGALHEVVFEDIRGGIDADTVHLAGDTLLWLRGRLLLRLEGARSRAQALRIARSVREAP
jgi:hypothetical protein